MTSSSSNAPNNQMLFIKFNHKSLQTYELDERWHHRPWCGIRKHCLSLGLRSHPSPGPQCRQHWEKLVLCYTNKQFSHLKCFSNQKLYLAGLWNSQRKSNLSSGTGTRLSFGSIVQNGKFSAAAWLAVSTLKKVDLLFSYKKFKLAANCNNNNQSYPTLGTPTMPTLRLVPIRPSNIGRSGSLLSFFGGILFDV